MSTDTATNWITSNRRQRRQDRRDRTELGDRVARAFSHPRAVRVLIGDAHTRCRCDVPDDCLAPRR